MINKPKLNFQKGSFILFSSLSINSLYERFHGRHKYIGSPSHRDLSSDRSRNLEPGVCAKRQNQTLGDLRQSRSSL